MKKSLVIYSCDLCGKQERMENEDHYPSEKGWFKLKKLDMDVPKTGKPFVGENKDFCCGECLNKFIGNGIMALNHEVPPPKPDKEIIPEQKEEPQFDGFMN